MIIEFSIGNFRSIRDLQTLSMVAAPIRSKNKEIDLSNVEVVNDKITLLKSKAIYGSNASGKSNLIKSIMAFILILRNSIKDEETVNFFSSEFYSLNEENRNKPIFFQISFILRSIPYRYGFTIHEGKISAEWLFGTPNKIESYYFEREGNQVRVNSKIYLEAKKFEDLASKGDNDIFRSNSLFISAVAAMGGNFSKTIVDFFTKEIAIVRSLDPRIFNKAVIKQMSTEQGIADITRILQAADMSILGLEKKDEEDIDSPSDETENQTMSGEEKKRIKRFDILSKHAVYDSKKHKVSESEYPFRSFESDGTQNFFYLAILLLSALRNGRILVVDEIDAHLHSLLSPMVINLFHSPETNPKGAQLIFTTHNTKYLNSSFLRRDQFCFVTKDVYGASTLRTLVEYKGIRNDASYEKDYLQGRYDAVPLLNLLTETFSTIINSKNEQ